MILYFAILSIILFMPVRNFYFLNISLVTHKRALEINIVRGWALSRIRSLHRQILSNACGFGFHLHKGIDLILTRGFPKQTAETWQYALLLWEYPTCMWMGKQYHTRVHRQRFDISCTQNSVGELQHLYSVFPLCRNPIGVNSQKSYLHRLKFETSVNSHHAM